MLSDLQKQEQPSPPITLSPEEQALADHIAGQLGERKPGPRAQIERLIHYGGADVVLACLQETLAIEAQGGIQTADGARRRTTGGVFFHLMRGRVSDDIRYLVFTAYPGEWRRWQRKQKAGKKAKQAAPAKTNLPPFEPFDWSQRVERFQPLLAQPGVVTSVKIMLTGRPDAISIHSHTVLVAMDHIIKPPTLPKGVPPPPSTPTRYTVYLALKHWDKVKDTLEQNLDDALIIEGVTAFDPELNGMAIFATNVTSKLLEAAKRQAKASPSAAPPLPPQPKPLPEIPPHLPPEAAQQLHDLYIAAEKYREKLAALEAKPEHRRTGYDMTHKLLQNTEGQIEALLNRYPPG